MSQKPKIAIYGTGQFGQYVTRFAHKKNWPIVAAFNRAGKKVGQDIGTLSGLDKPIGITVQDCDTANYDSCNADLAIVAMTDRLSLDMDAYRRLLGAGINVITHASEAYLPFSTNAKLAAEIDALAKSNNVTFTGTGIWDMSRIWSGILVAGPCTEINSFFHQSITDVERIGKEIMLRAGVGLTQKQFTKAMESASAPGGLYPTILEHVLQALGYRVTQSSEALEPVIFNEPVYCKLLDQELKPGIVCGTRAITNVETAEGITAEAHIEVRLFKESEIEHMYWKVNGAPSSSIRIERDDSGHFTASSLFNRIPDVISAPSGIQLVSQLGPLKHSALL